MNYCSGWGKCDSKNSADECRGIARIARGRLVREPCHDSVANKDAFKAVKPNQITLFDTSKNKPLVVFENRGMIFRGSFLILLLAGISCIGGKPITLKYLESNSWLLTYGQLTVAIDPVLQGNLDFGIPLLYSGSRRYIDGEEALKTVAQTANYILISQGLDDHAHTPTLKRLSVLQPSMTYVCPPSAVSILKSCGVKEFNIKVISPGQKTVMTGRNVNIEVMATNGALVGPPWQAKENGYVLRAEGFPSLYYEPHCMYEEEELSPLSVDCVITPIVAQKLPGYTLVDGDSQAVRLCELLKAKYVVPMLNGELDQTGILSQLLLTEGSAGVKTFETLLSKSAVSTQFVPVSPGADIKIGS